MQTWHKLTVWCEFASSQVVGLFTLIDTMNGARYINILLEQGHQLFANGKMQETGCLRRTEPLLITTMM